MKFSCPLGVGENNAKRIVLACLEVDGKGNGGFAWVADIALRWIVVDLLETGVGSSPAGECDRSDPDEDNVVRDLLEGLLER